MSGANEWYKEFFDGLYGQVLANQFDEARTLEEARVVKRLLGLRKGRQVLDVPCGMGRLTIPLAQMGLSMTGVDLTGSFLARARRRARAENLDIRFLRSDMRDIGFDAEFDAAFNWFGSFGYFSDADNHRFCEHVFRALKPGGRFLVEGINRSWLLKHFRPRSDEVIGGVRVEHHSTWDGRRGRVACEWTFSKGRATQRRRSSMRIYDGAEIRSLLRAAGFRDVQLFGRPPVGRFTRHSRRLIAVATRPKK